MFYNFQGFDLNIPETALVGMPKIRRDRMRRKISCVTTAKNLNIWEKLLKLHGKPTSLKNYEFPKTHWMCSSGIFRTGYRRKYFSSILGDFLIPKSMVSPIFCWSPSNTEYWWEKKFRHLIILSQLQGECGKLHVFVEIRIKDLDMGKEFRKTAYIGRVRWF